MPERQALVSILTLNWNAKETTLAWLDHLREIDYSRQSLEIIVHDNASVDGSQTAIGRKLESMRSDGWRNLTLVEASYHPGVTEAFNRAFAHVSADTEYVLRLDNDVTMRPDAMRVLTDTMRQIPDAGVVGCQVIHNNPRIPDYGAIFINWWGGRHRIARPDFLTDCDVLLGCILMIRRSVLDQLGFMFDPTLFFFQEEADLCQRIRRVGGRVVYNPATTVYHNPGTSSSRHSSLTQYLCIRNGVVFTKRYNAVPRKQVVYGLAILSALKQALMSRDPLALRAVVDGLREKALSTEWWNEEMRSAEARVHGVG